MRLIILSFAVSCVFTQINYDYSGNILFGTINRTSDASLIKVPFRFINYRMSIECNSFTLKSNLALEVSLSDETMSIDNRELYLSWYPSFGEVRLGKQINSWGVGSTNSPLDILTPVNYYYFFSRGIEKNIGTMSLAVDGYFSDYKLGVVYLFEHDPHYLPLGDPEMPITIDSLPEDLKIENIYQPHQFGINFMAPIHNIDFTFSYFKGYDKLMTFFGATAWNGSDNLSIEGAYIDTLLSYRNTNILGVGIGTFINDIRINSEIALFQTSDKLNNDNGILRDFNGNIDDICDENQNIGGFDFDVSCEESIIANYGLGSTAKYFQYFFEFEYPDLIFEITLIGQFLKYKLLNISNGLNPNVIPLQIGTIDFTTKNNFIPALGSPIFMFTMYEDENTGTMYMHESSVFYLNAKRFFMDNNLETNLRTFYDIKNHGNLIEIEFKYNLSSKINLSTALNKISGNSNLNNSYMFNAMEDFSHFRLEATYNF